MSFFSNIAGKLSALSKTQKIVTAAITTVSLVAAGGGAVLVSTGGNNYSEIGTESTQISETGTEIFGTEVTEVIGEVTVHMEMVSIEKDLKIKVVDEEGELVKDVPFEFAVAQLTEIDEEDEESAKEIPTEAVIEEVDMEEYEYETYVDEDTDGIVHILNLKGGQFLVQVKEVEGYIFEADTIKTWVKEKIEYKKVEIKNEVKNESQINAAVEDTAVNDVVVESVVTDTLPLLPTAVVSNEISRNDVDTSNFPKASKNPDFTVELKGQVVRYCTEHMTEESKKDEIPAKCEEAGSYTKVLTCKTCGNKTEEKVDVPALGHQEGAPVEENRVEAAIGQAGSYDSVTYCTGCNKEMRREKVEIPALADPNVGGTTDPGVGDNVGQESTEPTTEPTVEPTVEPTTEPTVEPTTETAVEPTSEPDAVSEDLDVTTRRYMGNSIVAVASEKAAVPNGTPYAVDAPITVSLPYLSKVYTHSAESQQIQLGLNIQDEFGAVDKDKIVFEIDHTDIADFTTDTDDNPTTVMIKGKKPGTVNVGIYIPVSTVDANGTVSYKTEKITCIVTVDNYEGEEAVHIKDNAGNLLYIDKNCTKPATPSHFTNVGIPLYGAPKYTGWTIIDGKLYYYKEDNTPATGSQVIGGVQYVFNDDGTLQGGNQSLGIDVSKWQGNINWTAVAQSGVKFAIIRCAYRGAATGAIVEDPYFRQNIAGATANGIKVGVYFFTQAINEYEAVEEASTAISLVSGYNLAYPIFIDTESATNGRANGLDKATRTAVVKAFCETVRNSGYKPGIYASKSWYNSKLDMSQLSTYNIWVAQYSTACTYGGRYDIWQYSSKGSIPGINGNVDVNIGYTNY